MILTREANIKINQSNLSYFESLGYETNIGDCLTIPIELLSPGSHLESDGKITLGGVFSRYNYQPVSCIARLNTDGTLDTSFILGTNDVVWTVMGV